MPRNGPTAKSYPTPEQYDRWTDRADELDMSVSEFIQNMVEAGLKVDSGFDVEVQPDESVRDLREQRNDMKEEVDRLRERVAELEERLHDRERRAVIDGVEKSEKATFDQVVDHVQKTAAPRVTRHLEELEGEALERDDEGFWHRADTIYIDLSKGEVQ